MKEYAIITDSACDLPLSYRKENGIDYAKMMMSYTTKDGVEHDGYLSLDWDELSPKEFYDILRSGIRIFTSQVSVENYLDVFLPHLEKGEDILYVACSSALSASLNAAIVLAEHELKERFPKQKIIVFDSLRAGMSEGQIVMLAVDNKNKGLTIEQNLEVLEKVKRAYKEIGIPESLSYLRRAGRVNAPAAIFGNVIGLKPILVFDEKGGNVAKEKAIGKRKAFQKMAEMIKEDIVNPEEQVVYLMNADCAKEDLEEFKEAILSKIKVKEFKIELLGPVIGASSGPGTMIFNYKGKQ